MDIVVLILTVIFAVSVVTIARVIVILRKRRRESKKEEEKARKEQEISAKKAKEEADDKARKETELAAKKTEDEERIKAEEKIAEERLRKEREEEALRKAEERLEKIKAEEENIEREAREKADKEKAERKRLEAEEKKSKAEAEQEAKAKKAEEEKARKEEAKKKEEFEHPLKAEGEGEKAGLEKSRRREEKEKQYLAKRVPLDKRGGRPRGPTEQRAMEPLTELKSRSLKPEIICWEEGWRWIVGIEVPEKLESPRVTQNDELLEQDASDESRYHLRHIEGTIKVAGTEGEKDIPLMEEGRNYLIFKMRKSWKGCGRLVRRPTTGYYLAIAPQEWKRDEEMSGFAPVRPESVHIDGYKAHFFDLRQNGDATIVFINAEGERIQVEPASPCFQLIGKGISDSSDDMGPLFGEEPPRIKTIDERERSNVGVIVVGEERSGRNRWRTQFVPQEGAIEQRMPDELTNRQGGWYYVRIYDNNDDLLESMDFRFSTGLKDIQIRNSECLPEPHGYNDVTVQFVHQAICKVEPADGEMHHALTIRRENGLTIVTVPPKPDYDKTHWILRDGDAETKVTVLVERIWWTFGKIELAPVDWTDKPITLSRRDFAATSDKALWVKFPRTRWISEIDVGFNRTKSRSYNVEVEKKEVTIPLRDFCDAEEIENKQEEFTMKIWVSAEETKTYEAIVLGIPAELPPTVEPREVQVKLPPPRYPPRQVQRLPLPLPQPEVKSCRGKRKGKGFSRNEIDNAGLTMEDVKRLHVPYDKRRKSSHSWNIEKLKSITER